MSLKGRKERSKWYFDKIAENYDVMNLSKNTGKMFDRFIFEIRTKKVHSILDVGCGTGELLKIISENVPEVQLWGVDISEKMLEKAKEKGIKNVKFILSDSSCIPMKSESFDVICCNHSFHHYNNPLKVLKEFQRLLKPNGILIIGENYRPTIKRIKSNWNYIFHNIQGDVWNYSEKEIRFLLFPYFSNVRYDKFEDRYCFITAEKKRKFILVKRGPIPHNNF